MDAEKAEADAAAQAVPSDAENQDANRPHADGAAGHFTGLGRAAMLALSVSAAPLLCGLLRRLVPWGQTPPIHPLVGSPQRPGVLSAELGGAAWNLLWEGSLEPSGR